MGNASLPPYFAGKDTKLFSILQTNCSKIVDENGKPLVVEHGTHADFTVFDINEIGSNSKDNGLFGAGFYFGTHAPAWLNDGSEDYRTMKVYLDIKHPFEVSDKASLDIYSEIVKKMDSPAMRGLTITGLNGKQMQVGEYMSDYMPDMNKEGISSSSKVCRKHR